MSPQPLAADLRSADDRDLPSRTDAIGAALSQVHRRAGRPARADRPGPVPDSAAGDADHRPGVPGVGLLDQGGVPADRPAAGTADQRVANWAEPTGLLRAVLLRHRSALHRGVVEPGQVSVQVQLDRDGQRGPAAHPVRRQRRRALHGVSGAHRHLSVRVDGAGQDLHRAEQGGVGAGHRRGGDVLQHRRVRAGAGVAGDGVGDRATGRSRRVWDAALVAASPAGDLSDLHQLRRAGNGLRHRGAAGLGAAKTGAGRGVDRTGGGGQAVSAVAAGAAGHPRPADRATA